MAPVPLGLLGGGGSFAAVLAPSGRGAPGAFGLAAGSNASPRARPPGAGGVSTAGGGTACDVTTGAPPGCGEYGGCGFCAAGRGTAGDGGRAAPLPSSPRDASSCRRCT